MTDSKETEALSPAERDLVRCVELGELLDLSDGQPFDKTAVLEFGSRNIRARVVRDIMLGRLAPSSDPHGLRLRGARIQGRLDLEHVSSSLVIKLYDCLLDEGINARDASLPAMVLNNCQLAHRSEPALDALRIKVAELNLTQTDLSTHSEYGTVQLSGSHIAGSINCNGARLNNNSGPALNAENMLVDQSVLLSEGFSAIGAGMGGAVRLRDASIVGLLNFNNAILRNESGTALNADGIQVRDLQFRGAFEATGTGENGTVRLLGAQIGGQLNFRGATLSNESGPALNADGMRVGDGVFLLGGFKATGTGRSSTVRLLGAQIGGQLNFHGATLINKSGPALSADGVEIQRDASFNDGFDATGAGELGTIRLPGAHIGGQLNFKGATLYNESGPALTADGIRVDDDMSVNEEFEAFGTIRLPGAHISGQLNFKGATLRNESGSALNIEGATIDESVFLSNGFIAIGGGDDAAVSMTGARFGSSFRLDPKGIMHRSDPLQRVQVDGLVYNTVPRGVSTAEWLSLLREGTSEYQPQPYQQLAAVHRAAGHDHEARRILMEQRRAQLDRNALTGLSDRIWTRVTGWTLGFGYQPWRALIGLLGVLGIAAVLACVLGADGGLVQSPMQSPKAPVTCTPIERIGVGLDLGTPLISTGARAHCDYANTPTGEFLTVSGWVLRLLTWAFATLFIAGFTGAVRKT
ncbi:hypothetical protein ACFVYA_10550 [Amycolatopsis sp. NPDC058278]|uniref:hypothetical protein n=1 Tax=Amycolatopsis sp. NPDC058278 TaxID=3346417 RepID=UPI0036D8345D